MKIALLPDMRPESGLGHLRRCQALASALEGLGCECVWPEPGEAFAADVLVVDHYRARPEADYKGGRRLSVGAGILHIGSAVLVQFDDNQSLDNLVLHNPADVVINGAPGAESLPYRLRDGATALLGPQYLCLDPIIQYIRRKGVSPEVHRIVVSLGAYPPQDLVDRVVAGVEDACGDAVVLPLHGKARAFLPLLATADIAVTNGGQTMLESVALGVPTIAIVMGDNQRAQVEHLFAEGVIEGGIPWDSSYLAPSLQSRVQMVVAQAGLRQYMAEAGRRLIDGRGAGRVAGVIVERAKRQCV